MLYTLKLCLFFGVLLRAMSSVLPSLNFVGRLRFRLRLQVVKVPEPTQAPSPTYLGRLRQKNADQALGGSGSGSIQ